MDEKKLTPENDLQELWELNGRVEAVEVYIKNYIEENFSSHVDGMVILSMLGKSTEGLPRGMHMLELEDDFDSDIEDLTTNEE